MLAVAPVLLSQSYCYHGNDTQVHVCGRNVHLQQIELDEHVMRSTKLQRHRQLGPMAGTNITPAAPALSSPLSATELRPAWQAEPVISASCRMLDARRGSPSSLQVRPGVNKGYHLWAQGQVMRCV